MNKPLLFLAALLCLAHGQSIAQQPGSVQWTTVTDPSPMMDTLHSIKVQSDGKIVVAGNSYQGSYMAIAVGRYDGGILDPSFGNNGIATTSQNSANAVDLQSDGKIVVAGGYRTVAVSDFTLARYKTDGSPDSSFGVNGIVQTDIGSGLSDVAIALAIQTDGRIVAAGRSGSSLALCRYKPDGSLDSSFNSDGKLTVGAAAGATCMKLQADGKILVCCGSDVIRVMPDGSLDNSFGANGIATLTHYFYGIAIQNDGKILLAGGNGEFVLQRLNATGVTDNGFGSGGLVITTSFIPNTSNPGQSAQWVCVQRDGRILAGGWAKFCVVGDCRAFALARYLTNGTPDNSFGVNGKVATYGISGLGDFAISYSAAINNNNEVVVAGITADDAHSQSKWALLSYSLGPSLDVPTVPGADKQITVAPNPAGDFARLQSTHLENGNWRLSLYDLTGRTLYSETVVVKNNAFDKSISLIGLPAAMYLVKLDNGSARMTVSLTKSR